MYIFRSASSFVVVIFATNCALWSDAFVFRFDVSIKCRIRQIWLVACSTCKLSAFFVTSCFSSFLLFYLRGFWISGVIFYVEVVNHVHSFHCTIIYHLCFTLIILLRHWEKLCIVFLLNNICLILCADHRHMVVADWRHLSEWFL